MIQNAQKVYEPFENEENEVIKDIWDCRKIPGVRIPAIDRKGYSLNFNLYPKFYRECMKRYFRTIITKKSISQCINILL